MGHTESAFSSAISICISIQLNISGRFPRSWRNSSLSAPLSVSMPDMRGIGSSANRPPAKTNSARPQVHPGNNIEEPLLWRTWRMLNSPFDANRFLTLNTRGKQKQRRNHGQDHGGGLWSL